MPTTRFAPSPTGYLHLGHAYSAFFAARAAENGTFLLRIEDIDPSRCKPNFTDALKEDLHWLGLTWPEPVREQSQHMKVYAQALSILKEKGLLYPCFCTRRDIEQEAQEAAQAPHEASLSVPYPGTCRHLSMSERKERLEQNGKANWRLNVEEGLRITGPLFWHDRLQGQIAARAEIFGDVVLARKDVATSYHLSATVDDHDQEIELVTRGEDLFTSTHIHRLLQALLGYQTPDYHHHALLKDEMGRRYAKRDKAVTLRALRDEGKSPADIKAILPKD